MARPVFKRGLKINQTKPSMGREDQPKLTDLVEMYDWAKAGSSGQVRATGPIQGRGLHKVKVMSKTKGEMEITKSCLAYNVETDEFDTDVECPYCNMPEGYAVRKKRYFMNVIDRRLTDDAPAKQKRSPEETKSGYKDIASNSWTPVRVLGVPSTFATRLTQLSDKNILKSKSGAKKQVDFNDDRYGFDLDISFDKKAAAANMYSCDRNQEERFTPLTEDELDYLLWDLDIIYPPEKLEVAKAEAKGLTDRWRKANGGDEEVDDDEEETERHAPRGKKPAGKPGKPAPKGRGRQAEEYDDDAAIEEDDDNAELDIDGEEGEYEDDTPPPRNKKPAGKKPSRREPEEDEYNEDEAEEGGEDEYAEDGEEGEEEYGEEEGEDFEEEGEEEAEEEEYEEPPRRTTPGKKPAGKPAARPTGKPAPRRREPEPEEEEYEAPRRPAKPAGKPAGKPGARPAGKPAAKKPARRSAEEDLDGLDDDDIPF